MTTTNAPRHSGTRYATLCLLALLAALCHAHEARAQWTQPDASGNISSTNTGNVGVGTSTPTTTLTVAKDQSSTTAIAVFNRGDGATSQASIGVSRTQDWSNKYLSFGVTAPSFTMSGFGETAYLHSGGLPLKLGSETANDILFFTNGISSTRMTITGGGNVGVGTTAPSSLFHLSGATRPTLTISDTAAAKARLFRTVGAQSDFSHNVNYDGTGWTLDDTAAGGSSISLGATFIGINQWSAGTGYRPTTTPLYINSVGNVGLGTLSPASRLHVAGNITVDGNINAKYQDVAEWVPTTQKLSAGTVVVLDSQHSNHVLASTASYDTRVAGVVSAQPGIALGEAGDGKALVATTGRVKVRVDATRAPVQIGDLLVTSDVEGVAMKSVPIDIGGRRIHAPGTLIGKALEPLEKGTGEILVLLSLQ